MEFSSAEEAARWLEEKLVTLESTLHQASDLRRLTQEGTREVLLDVDARPHIFAQDVHERVRRYTTQVHQRATRRLERDGFQKRALERACLEMLGDRTQHGRMLIRAMTQVLRERMELHSDEGTQLYEENRTALDEHAASIRSHIRSAYAAWEQDRESIIPWRSNRADQQNPMESAAFREAATQAVESKTEPIERSLEGIARATILLAVSKYYGEIGSLLSDYLSVAQNLQERGRTVHMEARQNLEELRREASLLHQGRHTADAFLLDDTTLDTILDELQIDASHFLRHNDEAISELGELDREGLAENIRGWVEHQLGGLSAPSLAQALGGVSHDSATLLEKLLFFLAAGQPLAHFNDDLALQFKGGQRAHTAVLVHATDPSLRDTLFEACHRMGLPDPQWSQGAPSAQGEMSMRVLQCAGGLPMFTMADRLLPLVQRHRATLDGKTPATDAPNIPVSALRDMKSSQELAELLPPEIEEAFLQEKALTE